MDEKTEGYQLAYIRGRMHGLNAYKDIRAAYTEHHLFIAYCSGFESGKNDREWQEFKDKYLGEFFT